MSVGSAREQHAGQIGAREQQCDSGDAHQNDAIAGNRPTQRLPDETRRRQIKFRFDVQVVGVSVCQLLRNPVQIRFRLCAGNSGLQAPDRPDLLRAARAEPIVTRLDLQLHAHGPNNRR